MAELGLYSKPRYVDITQSANYVSGVRNFEYVSSNYSNAYRLPTHQMKTSNDNTLLSTNHPKRKAGHVSSRAYGEHVSRRHDVDEARSHIEDGDRSRISKTPTQTTRQRDIAPVQVGDAPKQEATPSHPRDAEKEFLAGRKAAEYKYRSDDQLFATGVEFSPGKDRVVENKVIEEEYYNNKADPTTQANLGNYAYGKYRFVDGPYAKEWKGLDVCQNCRGANCRLAEQKATEAQVTKKQELAEEVRYLNNLADIEERRAREEDVRREYRKQIDEYHKSLAKPGENKVEKASRLREKIRLEAEEVEMQRAHDAQVRAERQHEYNNELGAQANARHNAEYREAELNAQLEYNHTGLRVGAYKGGNKPNLASDLKAQIEEKAEMRANLDMHRIDQSMPNDFLNYKDRFDNINHQIVQENRRLMVHADNTMAKEQLRDVHDAEAAKQHARNVEKMRDHDMMNQQVDHERRMLQEEYLRRAEKGMGLKGGLLNQMHERHVRTVDAVAEGREFKNDFSIGGIRSFGITNLDIRPQLRAKETRIQNERQEVRERDHQLVNQLDEYDRNKVQIEVDRKQAFGRMLNTTLNQQIEINEAKRNKKINNIKRKAAAVPKREPVPMNHHECALCHVNMD